MAPVSSFFAPRKKTKVDGDVDTQPTEATEAQAQAPSQSGPPTQVVFVDLDGVLVDFDQGVQSLTGQSPGALTSGRLWSSIAKAEHFYRHLPWTRDGESLWEALRVLRPRILTGVPPAHAEQVARDKFAWCRRELCVEVVHWSKAGPKKSHAAISKQDKRRGKNIWCKVITCWSRNKHLESGPGRVLIDDRLDLRDNWEARGGIFIHHVNTEQTLRLLREKKILPPLAQTEEQAETKAANNDGPSTEHKPTTNPAPVAAENLDSLLEKQDAAQISTESQPLKASGN
jgi:hypothetical protein